MNLEHKRLTDNEILDMISKIQDGTIQDGTSFKKFDNIKKRFFEDINDNTSDIQFERENKKVKTIENQTNINQKDFNSLYPNLLSNTNKTLDYLNHSNFARYETTEGKKISCLDTEINEDCIITDIKKRKIDKNGTYEPTKSIIGLKQDNDFHHKEKNIMIIIKHNNNVISKNICPYDRKEYDYNKLIKEYDQYMYIDGHRYKHEIYIQDDNNEHFLLHFKDITIVMQQTNKSFGEAINGLINNNNDIVNAIMDLID